MYVSLFRPSRQATFSLVHELDHSLGMDGGTETKGRSSWTPN